MEDFHKSVAPIIESEYEKFTPSEKIIADYFINRSTGEEDLSASTVSKKLHISEATITRFAKKCGYAGYREFIYAYKTGVSEKTNIQRHITKRVLSDYNEILNKTYSLINENQMENIVTMMLNTKRVYFYGIGSSGLVAMEMKSRFMRIGLICDAFTDPDLIRMNSALLDENCMVIALSISSESPVIYSAVKKANENKAKTILFTANKNELYRDICNEIVSVATTKNIEYENSITSQFPLLLISDIFYAYFLNSDINTKKEFFESTLSALSEGLKDEGLRLDSME